VHGSAHRRMCRGASGVDASSHPTGALERTISAECRAAIRVKQPRNRRNPSSMSAVAMAPYPSTSPATYARGEALDDLQLAVLAGEKTFDPAGSTGPQLAAQFAAAIGRAHAQLRATKESELHVTRSVGRAKLPASTMGLLFHAAEHTARHVGQIVTTAKLVSAL
jgi:hypothetical protein